MTKTTAARKATSAEFKRFFKTFPNILTQRGELGTTLLMGKLEMNMLKAAIGAGADVNATDDRGLTALHWAAFDNDPKKVQLLVKHGADINAQDLIRGGTPLLSSTALKSFDAAEILIKLKADPNIMDDKGNTPLHYATQRGHSRLVKMLVDHGANIHLENRDGYSPVDLSRNRNSRKIFELLKGFVS